MSDVSVIASGHRVAGTISAAEDLVVLGRVEGRIQSEATVVVEAQAVVEAEVVARHVIIKGIVVGDVSGTDSIEIAANAQVLGDLKTRRLTLRPGGRVLGGVHTGVETQAYTMSGRTAGAGAGAAGANWQRTRARSSGFNDEVVEPSSSSSNRSIASADSAAESLRTSKEPSREAH